MFLNLLKWADIQGAYIRRANIRGCINGVLRYLNACFFKKHSNIEERDEKIRLLNKLR